jgi:3-oxoacyl-[acyl-carrier-protein] synthase III
MYLVSMGHFWPEHRITNDFFNDLDIGSEAQWIEDRVGIKERRSVLRPDQLKGLKTGTTTVQSLFRNKQVMTIPQMAEATWSVMQKRLAVPTDAVDTVLSGTSVPDDDIPASACKIASHLGLERVRAFDVNSACSTFAAQVHVLRGLMQSGMTRSAAVFTCERYSIRMDYNDRKNCIIFGDGASGCLFSVDPLPGSLKVIDTLLESAPSGWEHIQMPTGECFHQNGAAVQKFAVTKTIAAAQDILARQGLQPRDAQWFIGHQANLRMLSSAMDKLGVSEQVHLYNVDMFGNQGAAGAPCVLSMNWERYRPGDYIVIAVVGAGLTWGSMLLQKQ